MNSTLLDLGFIEIKWYSFLILVSMIIGYFLVWKEVKKKDISIDELNDLLFYLIIVSILGARIYYVLFNLKYYLSDPLEIFMMWHGGLAIHGGIIAGLIFLIIYCKKKKRNLFLLTDIIVVPLILAQSIGRWGNFFNGEAFGRVVSLSFLENLHLPKFIINGMYINGLYREPTFLYESLICFIGFLLLIIIRNKAKIKTSNLTSIYLIWYGIERLIIESFRSDSLMLGPLKIAQIVSIIAIIGGIYLLVKSKNNKLYSKDKLIIK